RCGSDRTNLLDRQHYYSGGVITDGFDQFYCHGAEPASARHDDVSHADDRVGDVYHRRLALAGAAFAHRRRRVFAARSRGWHELFPSSGTDHQRIDAGSQRRSAASLAAFVLVLRPSGSVYRDYAGDGYRVRCDFDLLSPPAVWL